MAGALFAFFSGAVAFHTLTDSGGTVTVTRPSLSLLQLVGALRPQAPVPGLRAEGVEGGGRLGGRIVGRHDVFDLLLDGRSG